MMMTYGVVDQGWTGASTTLSRLRAALPNALRAAGPSLLFALRLWASVCLALFVAFYLELDNAYWAGTSAAIVCQPQLGASLRKGWFRMIGTLVGATMIVVLTACFIQDRGAFLGILALWGATCAFLATLLRNFASYGAALAGYTAMIIAADILGPVGGPNTDVFMVAVTRASEISIGIVSAGIILAGTDLGGSQRQLAVSFSALVCEITGGFARMLALAGPQSPDTNPVQRDLLRRVIALDPMVDQAIGESSQLRYYSPILQRATYGLFKALGAWRSIASHLKQSSDNTTREQAQTVFRDFPVELKSAPTRWLADPSYLHRICESAMRTFLALPASTPSLRLLADETAKLLAAILHVLDCLALLSNAHSRPLGGPRKFQLSVPDWLPALVNAGRAFVMIGVVDVFWVVTAWPGGAGAMIFVGVILLLLSPKGELAPVGALAVTLGCAISIVFAATIKFAVLPGLQAFPAFCAALGLYLIPIGFGLARSRNPALSAILTVMASTFVPLLQPMNHMSYNTAQFYNLALAVCIGCGAAAASFRLLPPLSSSYRARRLLALTLRDLRRLATGPLPPTSEEWESRMYGRLAAFPDMTELLQRAQLLAAFSAGNEIIELRHLGRSLAINPQLDTALTALAQGNWKIAIAQLARLDQRLGSYSGTKSEAELALRARARILAFSELLVQYAPYFDAGAPA